jgi:hypothetical protein
MALCQPHLLRGLTRSVLARGLRISLPGLQETASFAKDNKSRLERNDWASRKDICRRYRFQNAFPAKMDLPEITYRV